jgi:organic radical activating enzyme
MQISEMFGPVIQGEGISAGVPSFFLRMANCSLMCGGHNGELVKSGLAKWHCDSEKIWRQGTEKTPQEIVAFFEERGELQRILTGKTHVILTGGEPCLPTNLKAIKELIDYINDEYPLNSAYYEMETSGTRYAPTDDFFDTYIDQVNCSAKIQNSGMPKAMRVIPRALGQLTKHKNFWWKIVVAEEGDWDEFMADYGQWIPEDLSNVILMPAGSDIEELVPTSQVAWNLATKHNVRMCGRLQVSAWRLTTGV